MKQLITIMLIIFLAKSALAQNLSQNSQVNTAVKLNPVRAAVYKWNELPVVASEDRESRNILEGVSPHFEYLEIHATTQFAGAKPNKPNANDDIEECIIVKEGSMKVTNEGKSEIIGPGSVVLFMPKEIHSIENAGESNLTYYIMSYKSKKPMNIERGQTNGGSKVYNTNNLEFKTSTRGGVMAYFDRPTVMCERFELHTTQLDKKGPSHNPHSHIETEIFLIISGNVEVTIDGKEYQGSAGDLFFVPSGLFHGIRNSDDAPCKYFAYKWN